jgi:hypothetical protein
MSELPGYLKAPPRDKYDWARPTTWLLGARVSSRLKQLVLSQIHRGFDVRDWMSARPIPPDGHPGPAPALHRLVPDGAPEPAECWIDYVSDTGDVPRLVYRLAYLLQQDVLRVESDDGTTELQRGAVLLFGGDAAYPVADEPSLNERVRAPFQWARQRLADENAQRSAKDKEQGRDAGPEERRCPEPVLLFGVPANHDYYDMLNGFARQFRAPCTGEGQRAAKSDRLPPLALEGYERRQQASYFALALPCGWHLWGLDAQDGLGANDEGLDTRQVQYFQSLPEREPQKLIVASALPVIVRRARIEEGHRIDTAYHQLGLPRVYRDDGALKAGQVRIDLAGDIHLYERHYGVTCAGTAPPAPASAAGSRPASPPAGAPRAPAPCAPEDGAESRRNYAAVVCGLGGVFHHPGQVRHGNVPAPAAWPRPAASARAIGRRLMNPLVVSRAGAGGLVGAVSALLFWWLATAPGQPSVLRLPWLIATGAAHWPAVLGAFFRTFVYLVAAGAWGALIWGAHRWRKRVHAAMEPAPAAWHPASRRLFQLVDWLPVRAVLHFFGSDPREAHVFILTAIPRLAVIAGLGGLIVLARHEWFARAGALSAANIVVWLFLLAMFGFAWAGRTHLGCWRSAVIFALAVVHGCLQIMTPLLWTPLPRETLLLGAVLCLGTFLLPYVSGWLLGASKWTRLTCLSLWLALAAVFVGVPVVAGLPAPERAWQGALVAVIAGAFFACLWLGWYLLVCLQWHAHGNDAASVARVDTYAVFLRIKLTEEAAEVWAVQADEIVEDDENGAQKTKIVGRIIDHFQVTAR